VTLSTRLGLCVASAAALTIAAIAFAGCSGSTDDSVVARVGAAAISKATVERWASALAGGRTPSDSSRRSALRAQALDLLIPSQWLLNEAAEDGIRLPPEELQRQLQQKQRTSFPGGAVELREFLEATGQSTSNVTFEAEAELASAKIRQMLAGREPAITEAQVASYYNRHKENFLIPEHRTLNIVAFLPKVKAEAFKRNVEAGRRRFTSLAARQTVELTPRAYALSRGRDANLARAIHFACPNVLSGPVTVYRIGYKDYYLFEVKRIVPAKQRTLAQVQGSIRQQLTAERQRRTLTAFIRAWRQKWIARTNCSPGYVVQKCRQYRGPRTPEDPTTFS